MQSRDRSEDSRLCVAARKLRLDLIQMLAECTENAVVQLAENRLTHRNPIFQVLNLAPQRGGLMRVAVSDGQHFMQTLAKKELIKRCKVKRLNVIRALEISYEGKDRPPHRKVAVLRNLEVLSEGSYVIGKPEPVRCMTVEFLPEVKEREGDSGDLSAFVCAHCKDLLVVARSPPQELLFPHLANAVLCSSVEILERGDQLISAQRVTCTEGHDVGHLILASAEARQRGMYQLAGDCIKVQSVPQVPAPASAPAVPHPKEMKEDIVREELGRVYESVQREIVLAVECLSSRCSSLESGVTTMQRDLLELDVKENRD